jgi:hypothetical protein
MMNTIVHKRIAIIIPYFGNLPNNFSFWLVSAKWNSSIDFLLWTDDRAHFDYPSNLKVTYISFADFKKKIQSKFNFHISLENPYKLCDYRPAYGHIFDEELKGYDFWGHCDLDVVWGNIRKYLTDEILDSYDKILDRGHLTLYRNTDTINQIFFRFPFLQIALQDFRHYGLDEGDLNDGLWEKDQVWTDRKNIADIEYQPRNWSRCEYQKPQCFRFSKGELTQYVLEDTKIIQRQYMYLHFQRRAMFVYADASDTFLVSPQGFFSDRILGSQEIQKIGWIQSRFPWNPKNIKHKSRQYIYRLLYSLFGIKRMHTLSGRRAAKLWEKSNDT